MDIFNILVFLCHCACYTFFRDVDAYILFKRFLNRSIEILLKYLIVATDQTLVVIMSNNASLEMRFKIGVLKELHRRELITKEELEKAIKIASEQHINP